MVALVIQFLVPLMTHSSPSWTAVVRNEPGSEPASGSDRQKAGDFSPEAQSGRYFCLSSSLPCSWIGSVPSSCTIRISALDAHALAISSTATFSISVPVPVPPTSSGNGSPRMSCSARVLRTSHGYSPVRSISAARGAISPATSSRMVCWKSLNSCGSV